MKKITLMITGASGFIGTNFINKYKEKYNIVPVDLLNEKPEELNFENVDCILHLAALVHQMKGAPRESYFEINTELTRRMAETAKKNGVRHFVFYSTVKVYGYDGDIKNHSLVLNEFSECNPKNDPYGESKLEAEKILKKLENSNFIISIIRPPLVYGKGVKGNMETLVKLIKKVPILPFNYTKNKRSMVNVENLLYMTSLIIEKKEKGVFLPLDEKNISIKEIFDGIKEELKIKRYNIGLPNFIIEILYKISPSIIKRIYGSLQFENKYTREKLNYVAIKSYNQGIKSMIK